MRSILRWLCSGANGEAITRSPMPSAPTSWHCGPPTSPHPARNGRVPLRGHDAREIDAAVEAGAADVNQLKHFTRCGMGPCQGRMCGDVVAELVGGRRRCARRPVSGRVVRPCARAARRPRRDLHLRRHPDPGARAAMSEILRSRRGRRRHPWGTVALFASRGGMRVAFRARLALPRGLGRQCRHAHPADDPRAADPLRAGGPRHVGFGPEVARARRRRRRLRRPLARLHRTEAELLTYRAGKRREAGAPIELVSGERAPRIEPGLSRRRRVAGRCGSTASPTPT